MRKTALLAGLLFGIVLAIGRAPLAGQSVDPKPVPAAAPASSAAPDLPAGDAVLQRFIEASGGQKAYGAVKTEISTGTFSIAAAGISGSIKIYSAAPNKSYAVVEIPNVGKLEEGTDGKTAWQNSVLQGARIKTGDEAAQAIREGAIDLRANWKQYYKSAETTGIEDVNGKACYRVVMTPIQGSTETDWYEKDSGLLVKQSAVTDTPMGKVPAEVLVGDYRKQGDLTLPFHLQQHIAGQEFEIKLDKHEVNPEIPDSRFDLPPEIKALQK